MDGGEPDRRRSEAHGRGADRAAAEVAAVDDPAVLDLDERPQLVGLAEAVGPAQLLEVARSDLVGWRLVVVGDAELERDLGQAFDGF